MKSALLLLFLSTACCTGGNYRDAIQNAVSRNVLIFDRSTPEATGYCSGVALDATTVITAGHCYSSSLVVNGLAAVVIKRGDEKKGPDLMLLRVRTTVTSRIEFSDARQGDEVISVGNHAPIVDAFNHGYVMVTKAPVLLLDLKSIPGFSGSGVYGVDGRLVGLLVGLKTAHTAFGELPSFCIAVTSKDVQKFWNKETP